jgi:hypothetical protein
VLALTLASLLHRRVRQAGIAISQATLLEELKKIKEITDYCPAQTVERLHLGGHPRSERTLTHADSQQSQLFRVMDLSRFQTS